jgi:hypothetical protein
MWVEQETNRALVYGPQRKMEILSIEADEVSEFKSAVGFLKGNSRKLQYATRYKQYDIIFEEDEKAKIIKTTDDREVYEFEEICIAGSIKKTFLANSKSNHGRGVMVVGDLLLFLSHRASSLVVASLKDLEGHFQSPEKELLTTRIQEEVADFAVEGDRVVTLTEGGIITTYRNLQGKLVRHGRGIVCLRAYPVSMIATSIGYSEGQTLVSCYNERKKSEFLFHLNKNRSVSSRMVNEGMIA